MSNKKCREKRCLRSAAADIKPSNSLKSRADNHETTDNRADKAEGATATLSSNLADDGSFLISPAAYTCSPWHRTRRLKCSEQMKAINFQCNPLNLWGHVEQLV